MCCCPFTTGEHVAQANLPNFAHLLQTGVFVLPTTSAEQKHHSSLHLPLDLPARHTLSLRTAHYAS